MGALWQHPRAVAKRTSSRNRRKRTPRRTGRGAWIRRLLLLATGFGLAYVLTAFAILDHRVRTEFGQTQWRLPAHVYTQPLELYSGRDLDPEVLEDHLVAVGYRATSAPDQVGEYSRDGDRFRIHARAFRAAHGGEPRRRIEVDFAGGAIAGVRAADGTATIARIEPERIGSVFPGRAEDRVLVRLEDVPERLVDALLAVEDQAFREHHGVRPSAIARAAIANLRAGRTVQGGSTITQQLAKNFFLSSEQTLARKFDEALMALSLEWHFDKDEILEAYLNEVYLGQDGPRSINGFGLGARYWFNRPLDELDLHEFALLVGMIRGPSYYDARARPERARRRRDVVLEAMVVAGAVDADAASVARAQPLDVAPRERVRLAGYPAYIDLVRRQLAAYYDEEDLRTEGLRVYTHLDPRAQAAAEAAVSGRLDALDGGQDLQGAAIIAEVNSGAVVAVVGDRAPRTAGFNRALDARRQVGSLAKSAVYLAALGQPQRYTLATLMDDAEFSVDLGGGDAWRPRNFDGEFPGEMALIDALAQSRNVATARLGMDIGLDAVGKALAALGVNPGRRLHPADLLGAFGRTPLEVAAMYQTLAAGGFDSPLSTIAEVHDAAGEPLARSPLRVRQALPTESVFLVNHALHEATRTGTARALTSLLPGRAVAGKTGTTNDLRDSWFAGFDGRHVGVAWVGRDDNLPAGLTGSAGALPVWADMMRDLPAVPLQASGSGGIEWARVAPERGRSLPDHCTDARRLPFLAGSVPPRDRDCREQMLRLP